MTKRRLRTIFVLGILLLGSLVGIGVNSQATSAANFIPVPATAYFDALGYAVQLTGSTVQETAADAESESESEAPESATYSEYLKKKDESHSGPEDGQQN